MLPWAKSQVHPVRVRPNNLDRTCRIRTRNLLIGIPGLLGDLGNNDHPPLLKTPVTSRQSLRSTRHCAQTTGKPCTDVVVDVWLD